MKGIMFTEPLFNAVIEGRKMQTRRIVKPQPDICGSCYSYKDSDYGYIGGGKYCYSKLVKVNFNDSICGRFENSTRYRYQLGEKVFIQEPYCLDCDFVQHEFSKEWKANGKIRYKYNGDELSELSRLAKGYKVWSNKLFMPAEYARYFIEITGVRCERLQDISDEDCLREGILINKFYVNDFTIIKYKYLRHGEEFETPQQAYAALINKINGKGTWESNPYVWVYDFKLLE